MIIVVPAFDEQPEATLHSLGQNHVDPTRLEVILVLNHSEDVDLKTRKLHQEQAKRWNNATLQNGVKVYTLAAFDLPPKQAGVGLARKIGMDAALQRFSTIDHDGLIVCLDADCTVSPNYLEELLRAQQENVNGLSLHFEHPLMEVADENVKQQIIDYEIWLRYYIQALRSTGYPHAFHTIGSSMAVRASVYAKTGGMNRRKAGEDFYFLHKLIPQGRFFDLSSCTVYPSARISERVPFGTGRAMLEMKAGEKDFSQVYHPEIFKKIGEWLALGEKVFALDLNNWPGFIKKFAEANGWERELQAVQKRSTTTATLIRNFSFWFDGFKMLKLVHFARDHYYPNMDVMIAAPQLFDVKGADREQLLFQLRQLDKNSPFTIFS